MNNYTSLLQTIMEYGKICSPRGKEIKELMHVKLVIHPNENVFSFPGVRELDFLMAYAYKEFAWYYCGDRNSDYIQNTAKIWKKIVNSDNSLNSNYGYLVYYHKTPHPSLGDITYPAFAWALYSLLNDKDSRQAIITYNNGGYNYPNDYDYICTQHQAFFIRDNVLKCFIALRSSDSIFGLPYNMMWWSLVHQHMLMDLKEKYPELTLGDIEVDIYSSHIYQPHYELVEKMLAVTPRKHWLELRQPVPLGNPLGFYIAAIPGYLKIEP